MLIKHTANDVGYQFKKVSHTLSVKHDPCKKGVKSTVIICLLKDAKHSTNLIDSGRLFQQEAVLYLKDE